MIKVLKKINHQDWGASLAEDTSAITHTLESGSILLFPHLPFLLLDKEKKFLSPNFVTPGTKNISFDPNFQSLRGTICSGEDYQTLKDMIQRFFKQALTLINKTLPAYTHALQIGRTSFRPVEISGRISSYRKDDTRLHVDAFPATPNQGRRILRVFTNINPNNQDRLWRVGEPFPRVAEQFLPQISKAWPGKSTLLKWFNITKSYRTRYDHIMLQIHDRMKRDTHYQKQAQQQEIRFQPGHTWIVQTDHVSHAAMHGQHVLEQTFYLPISAMLNPEQSPLRILEKFSQCALV